MIATKRGKYRVDLFVDEQAVSVDDALVTISQDEFYDLFGSMAYDHMRNLGRVELDCSIVPEEPK